MHDGPQTATQLAEVSPLTHQAVVKRLQALADVGLASPARIGREVRYASTPELLAAVVAWLAESGPAWDRRIERLVSRVADRG